MPEPVDPLPAGAAGGGGERRPWDAGPSVSPEAASIPPSAPRSPDGRWWWDGAAWRAVPGPPPATAPVGVQGGWGQAWPGAPAAAARRGGLGGPLVAVAAVLGVLVLAGGGAAFGIHLHDASVAAAESSSSSSSSSASSASSRSSASSASSASSRSADSSRSSASSASSLASALSASASSASAASASSVSAANAVTASSPVAPDKGSIVYTDSFGDPSSGWLTDNGGAYTVGGYKFGATGTSVNYSPAPYDHPVPQLALSVTATTDGASGGFGVVCADVTSTKHAVGYEFFAIGDGTWLVDRRDFDNPHLPTELASGRATATPGSRPLTVEAVCASLADGRNVRLMLFIDGHLTADLSDHPASLPGDGWVGSLAAAAPISFVATNFSERNLDS